MCCVEGLNKSTRTCGIWLADWLFYSWIIHSDNNSSWETITRPGWWREMEESNWGFIILSLIALFAGCLLRKRRKQAKQKKNCRGRNLEDWTSLLGWWNWSTFSFLSNFWGFSFSFPPVNLFGDGVTNKPELRQTNQYAVIFCPLLCIMLRHSAVGIFPLFPFQWRAWETARRWFWSKVTKLYLYQMMSTWEVIDALLVCTFLTFVFS